MSGYRSLRPVSYTHLNAHFITDNGGIDVYITQNGNITKSEQDIFAETFLKKGLVDIAE